MCCYSTHRGLQVTPWRELQRVADQVGAELLLSYGDRPAPDDARRCHCDGFAGALDVGEDCRCNFAMTAEDFRCNTCRRRCRAALPPARPSPGAYGLMQTIPAARAMDLDPKMRGAPGHSRTTDATPP
jgi:hypothetical protein